MRSSLLLLAILLTPTPALACATCGAGDPTLTLAGTEQPFAGRLRFSLAVASSGIESPAVRTAERRLTLGAAWAPSSDVMLSASAPLVLRQLEVPSLAGETGLGPGDLDLRGRFVVLRDRALAPTHLVTLQVGAQFPLAPALSDAQGVALSDEAQTASTTVAMLVGLAWSVYATPWSLQTYALARVPSRGLDGRSESVEVRGAALGVLQAFEALSLVFGAETRMRTDPAIGGAALFATGGMMLRIDDLIPYALVRIPLFSAFGDGHAELTALELGLVIDA